MTNEQQEIIQEKLKPLYQYANLDMSNTRLVLRMVEDVNKAVMELRAFGIVSYDSEGSSKIGRQMIFSGLFYDPFSEQVIFDYKL